MTKRVRSIVYPLLAAIIWGTAFTAQSVCAEYMSPFFINGIRSLIAAAVLAVVTFFISRKNAIGPWRELILGSLACGFSLFVAVNLQQIAIPFTATGKVAFVTSFYTVIVPVLGMLFGRTVNTRVWVAIVVSLIGLYLLCMGEGFKVGRYDILLIACAFFFAIQIMFLSHYTKTVNAIALSCGQFIVVGVLSLVVSFISEHGETQDLASCLPSLLYIAIISSALAYTLQVAALRDGETTITTLLYSLESVFGLLAGVVILSEKLSTRELIGCLVIFVAVLFSQLPDKLFEKIKPKA